MADLFALEELVDYMQVSEFPTSTLTLARTLTTTKIRNAVGAVRYDALTDVSVFMPIALDLAKRMLTNPGGARSEAIDDYSITYAVEVVGADLTDAEVRELRRLAGRPSAFTIRPEPPARRACLLDPI